MSPTKVAPYGSWKSPITVDSLLAGSVGLSAVAVDASGVYWIETRPLEGGRNVVVRWVEGDGPVDVTPAGFNAHTRVHEYGGGDYAVHSSVVYFSNDSDQRLYRQSPGELPQAITPAVPMRYADMIVDAARDRLICVREDHTDPDHEPVNSLVAVPLAGGEPVVLAEGNDFYASPRLSPDGRRLAWLTWNHPNMPWDGTELWLADIDETGRLVNQQLIAGGAAESIFQPEWSPPDAVGRSDLHFVSDRTGWWNLYRRRNGQDEALFPQAAEFGMPQWVFGQRTYGFAGPYVIICAYTQAGRTVMARLDTAAGTLTPLDWPYAVEYPSYGHIRVTPAYALFVGVSPVSAPVVVRVNLATSETTVLWRSSTVEVDPGYLSAAEPITYPTAGGEVAYGYYYPPRNKDIVAPEDERPPLIVTIHGGPTSGARTKLDLARMYWTSRGFAVLDVNHRGSTGFGRPFRERLYGNWGIVDVEDCIYGARYLAERGQVDEDRLIIRGGSAGGYTSLSAITFHDVFRAAASYFGVSDAEALALETHKFESRYMNQLIGPYPKARETYVARSPIHLAHECSSALILFQGLDDKVVLPSQSEAMYQAVLDKGLPVAYIPFEGEGHGFRKAETLKRSLESELYFYSRVFDFELAEPVEPVPIENLPG